MKKIEAFIRPEKLEAVKDALGSLHINGLSISQIMGYGNQRGWKEYVRGNEVDINFLPKIKAEIVVLDDQVDDVVSKITEAAKTGDVGDGKIFVSEITNAIRIRTDEKGEDALK